MTTPSEHRIEVALPSGPVPVSADVVMPDDAWAAMCIAHGAGAGYRHPFLLGFAAALNDLGVATLRFNLPYAEAGRRMPGPAAHAIGAWSAVHTWFAAHAGLPVWAAGKSYGGRMASMAAAEGMIAPTGLVYLGYPLHAPGKPEAPRSAHLVDVTAPQLFVEGTNDPFVDPHAQLIEAVAGSPNAEIVWIEGGGHSFEVKGRKRPADVIGGELAPLVTEWMRRAR